MGGTRRKIAAPVVFRRGGVLIPTTRKGSGPTRMFRAFALRARRDHRLAAGGRASLQTSSPPGPTLFLPLGPPALYVLGVYPVRI
jgi:hypothetical protein